MLEYVILMLSLLATGQVGTGTVFGSSRWDPMNPHSRLACEHREIDDNQDLVIAHNTLPCGQRVWLYNPRTGRATLARVADRGPRHALADLSPVVARRLAHNGREPVLLVAVPPVPSRAAQPPDLDESDLLEELDERAAAAESGEPLR
jgi:rare lipoprotein A (peptidoglycan hydrolase)